MSVVDDVVIRTEQLTKVYPGGLKAVDELDLEVHQGEIFGLLGPNGAGKTTTAGMLTTRVIPTSGRAFVGGIDVVAHPTAAKQVIGVVPQSNTLDRSLTVWENLYFHGRYFGMSAAVARREADRLLEQFRLVRARQGTGGGALGRHGAAPHGGAGDHAPPRDPLPRRAHRRARSAEPPRAVGDPRRAARRGPDDPPHHALHGGGRRALQPPGHHRPRAPARARAAGRAQALDRRRHRRHRQRRRRPRRAREGPRSRRARARSRRHASTPPSSSRCRRRRESCPLVFGVAERHGFEVSDLSVTEPTLETVFINLTGKDLRE